MAPSTKLVRRASTLQRNDIAWIVGIAVAGFLLLCLIILAFVLIRRWRKRRLANEHYTSPSASRAHKFNLSDTSSNPLLEEEIRGEWRSQEKQLPPIRQSIEEVIRDDRDIRVKDPMPTYPLFLPQTPNPSIASPSRSTHRLDPGRSIDKHYHFTSPERPPLPPLVIPNGQIIYPQSLPRATAVVAEETPPTQPPSSCPSPESLYSQLTMDSSSQSSSAATYFHLPLTQEMIYGAESPGEGLKRGDTHLVGNLLKARAQRNPAGLVRTSSQVSRIERTGSIKSVVAIDKNERPYSRRYRSKKKKTRQDNDMEVVMEGSSENGSLRGPSSSYPPPWDPTLFVQTPPPAAFPPRSFLIMDKS